MKQMEDNKEVFNKLEAQLRERGTKIGDTYVYKPNSNDEIILTHDEKIEFNFKDIKFIIEDDVTGCRLINGKQNRINIVPVIMILNYVLNGKPEVLESDITKEALTNDSMIKPIYNPKVDILKVALFPSLALIVLYIIVPIVWTKSHISAYLITAVFIIYAVYFCLKAYIKLHVKNNEL
jgi:hypothetical protein